MFFLPCRHLCHQLVARFRRRPARRPLARPSVEGIEDRSLLSITFGSDALGENWTISVVGGNGPDTVTAQIDTNGISSFGDQVVVTRIDGNGAVESKTINLWKTVRVGRFTVWVRNVTRIAFEAGDGNNVFDNQTDIPSRADGGSGRDIFYGGSGRDTFYGDGGTDHLWGRGGDDYLNGDDYYGTGNDWLHGGAGNDTLKGGRGGDHLYGEAGDDFLADWVGAHDFDGEGGNDTMSGGDGHDRLQGGTGQDYLSGGAGNDQLYGGPGLDHLDGGAGNDRLAGWQDGYADVLNGGSGADLFQAELYWQSVGGGFAVLRNRDQPQDFGPGDGTF
jgi:Ca2+-binding RTX toxin-like protein